MISKVQLIESNIHVLAKMQEICCSRIPTFHARLVQGVMTWIRSTYLARHMPKRRACCDQKKKQLKDDIFRRRTGWTEFSSYDGTRLTYVYSYGAALSLKFPHTLFRGPRQICSRSTSKIWRCNMHFQMYRSVWCSDACRNLEEALSLSKLLPYRLTVMQSQPSVTALRRWLYTAAILRFFSGDYPNFINGIKGFFDTLRYVSMSWKGRATIIQLHLLTSASEYVYRKIEEIAYFALLQCTWGSLITRSFRASSSAESHKQVAFLV